MALVLFYFFVSGLIANGMAMPLRRPICRTPSFFGIVFEEVSFNSRTDNVSLEGWYIDAGQNKTIILMPGGKQNREDTTTKLLELCVDLAKRGFSILTFDRRGCGTSEASRLRTRACLDRDIAGAVDYIRNRKGLRENIFLFGFSLGALAALACAKEEKSIKAVVSDSCFSSISEMASRILKNTCKIFVIFQPGAVYMGRLIFGLDRENAIDKVPYINCPIFFINGAEDKSVPPEDTYRLIKASNNPLDEIWIVASAGHTQSYITHPKEYIDRVVHFLSDRISK